MGPESPCRNGSHHPVIVSVSVIPPRKHAVCVRLPGRDFYVRKFSMSARLTTVFLLSLFLCTFAPSVPWAQSAEGSDAAAQMQVRMTALEEEIRTLQGTVEKLSYQNQQ